MGVIMIIVGILIVIPIVFIIGTLIYNKIWTYNYYKKQEKLLERKRLEDLQAHEEKISKIMIDHSYDYEIIKLQDNTITIPERKLPYWGF